MRKRLIINALWQNAKETFVQNGTKDTKSRKIDRYTF